MRQRFADAEKNLRKRVPTLIVEYNDTLDAPEVIFPDVRSDKAFLTVERQTNQRKTSNAEVLRTFLAENKDLVGLTERQIDQLRVVADYTNPDGVLSYAHLKQFIGGVPVFQGEVKAGFTKRGEMFASLTTWHHRSRRVSSRVISVNRRRRSARRSDLPVLN